MLPLLNKLFEQNKLLYLQIDNITCLKYNSSNFEFDSFIKELKINMNMLSNILNQNSLF